MGKTAYKRQNSAFKTDKIRHFYSFLVYRQQFNFKSNKMEEEDRQSLSSLLKGLQVLERKAGRVFFQEKNPKKLLASGSKRNLFSSHSNKTLKKQRKTSEFSIFFVFKGKSHHSHKTRFCCSGFVCEVSPAAAERRSTILEQFNPLKKTCNPKGHPCVGAKGL